MTTALIVVDVQNDFAHPEGSLALDGAEEALEYINGLQGNFEHVIYTRDSHPEDTAHFDQWPPHCVDGTWGAEFHEDLYVREGAEVVLKGTGKDEDGYSGFSVQEIDGDVKETRLDNLLDGLGVDVVFIVGLALDVCVKDTALDAVRKGYRTIVLRQGTAPVTPEGGEQAVRELEAAGVDVR